MLDPTAIWFHIQTFKDFVLEAKLLLPQARKSMMRLLLGLRLQILRLKPVSMLASIDLHGFECCVLRLL
jgi:hypothetical protein